MNTVAKENQPAQIDDAALVDSALDGDRFAQDALFRRHGRRALRLAARLLGSYQDAEDVLHDAYLAAFSSLHTLRDPSRFSSWLLRIVALKVRMRLRKKGLLRRLGLDRGADDATLEALAVHELTPEKVAELSLIDDVLRKAPADDRIAWILSRVEGYTHEEAAELVGVSASTIKRRVARQDQKLKLFVGQVN